MRQVAEIVYQAFNEHKSKTLNNTSCDDSTIYLHNNAIIRRSIDNDNALSPECIEISNAGWYSITTKSRLNDFFRYNHINASIWQKKGNWYLRIAENSPIQWDGRWIKVN